MSAPVGPRSGPAPPQPPPPQAPQSEMPDLSHLTEEERKIILAVMERQKKEEEKEQSVLNEVTAKEFREEEFSVVMRKDDQVFNGRNEVTLEK
ncbi:hypothetical protein KIL84_011426 [Mauremys mutica]|uniref:RabBD domain-containing protein n=1 Tax=Mauremys mutica TaxID=74926 RepID=A0A9D3XC14_9SAUR|nr:hypothetical protein KIL84_011426 [Mauremys mutica]